MKITKKLQRDIKIWCSHLRSGKFKQTKYVLNNDKGYCCLGVGCKIFTSEDLLELDKDGFIEGVDPIDQSESPKWLDKITDDFNKRSGGNLVELNDQEGFTFDEIADMLELVYIYEILKRRKS